MTAPSNPGMTAGPDPTMTLRLALTLWLWVGSMTANAIDWPQRVEADEGAIVIYQPQPESLTGNVISGRAAMSLELNDRDDPVFGAFWFEGKLDTDTSAGTAILRSLEVTDARWPDSTDAHEQRFTRIVESALPAAGLAFSLDRLSASLEEAEVERKSLADLKSDAPRIVFVDHLAVLLLYDGKPGFGKVENGRYERALNTPFLVVRDRPSGTCYLSSGTWWYSAPDPLGPWTPTTSPPAELTEMLPEPATDEPVADELPEIVVATEPTELIVTDGMPDWQSLTDAQLLYVENTETPWLRDLQTGNMYVLLSGRWFRAASEQGPWTFVPADELPASFRDIPPGSDIGGLRVSVAGTPEAKDAVLDAQIPQTAAISRDRTTLEVEYDGEPRFESISGTSVAYAVNTGMQVLEVDGRYYAVDNGVWFTAASATGPWSVADTIPQSEIAKIPPSSPVYNTTYVHVYEATPEVVYVGYTPGYLWSFPYYGVPVYGTGWYYPPYWGSVYYPRPPTWGLHVGYNPWTGWSFGMSWSNGFFSFGMSWSGGWGNAHPPWRCCSGWYGGGYRRPVVINTGDVRIGNSISFGNRITVGNRINRNDIRLDRSTSNLYRRPVNRSRLASPAMATSHLERARPAAGIANDVFADRHGNVARKVDRGWETRRSGGWAAAPAPESRYRAAGFQDVDFAGLDRAHRLRERGVARERFGGGLRWRR